MKRYTSYKTTDQSWIDSIPDHWDFLRAKMIFDNPKEKNVGNKEKNVLSLTLRGVINNDIENPIGLAPSDYSTYQVFEKDDLVFKLIDLENISTSRVGIVPERGVMSSAYIRFAPRTKINIRYFYLQYYDWWARRIFNGLGAGVRQTLSATDLQNYKIAVPPRAEQDQIVRFLDWKVSQIDRLIAGYQKEIALLKERRVTIIDRAVTKGIDPEAHFKPSDTNWMGEIPVHWDVHKTKQHFKIRKEIAGKEGYDVLSITQQGLKIKDIASNEGQMAKSYAGYQFVYPGDFAMNHMDLLTGYIGLSDCFGVTSPDYRVFTLTDTNNCLPEYYLYVFQLGYKRKIFYGLGHGAANKGRWRLPADNFKNYDIPVPPIDEQKQIVEFLNGKLIKLDAAIEGIDHQISLLGEYRTRLICDAVTGQIDVRDVVIPEGTAAGDAPVFCNDADEGEVGMDADEY